MCWMGDKTRDEAFPVKVYIFAVTFEFNMANMLLSNP